MLVSKHLCLHSVQASPIRKGPQKQESRSKSNHAIQQLLSKKGKSYPTTNKHPKAWWQAERQPRQEYFKNLHRKIYKSHSSNMTDVQILPSR